MGDADEGRPLSSSSPSDCLTALYWVGYYQHTIQFAHSPRQDTKGRDREGPRDEDEGADEKEEPNSYRPPLLPGLFCSIQGGVSNISPYTRIHTSGVLFHLLLFMYLLLPSSIQTPTHHMSCYRILSIYRSFLLLLYLLCVISANHP